MPEPAIGHTLGGCETLAVIGHGGMGIIFKARQKSLDRVVALKILSPKLANDVNFVTRFQREARAIAKVNHPNILAVYDVGAEHDTHYMIMELVEGESLAELQTRLNGPLNLEDAARYVVQAAQGLEAAHAGGITHRDVKPENLMMTKKGIIKVSDFGLAKEADTSTTSADAVMGTPAFMSPEQCDGKKIDHRTDIYSLGGTFYKLLTGRLPFEAETAMSMMYRHKHEALVPPHEIVSTLPASIGAVVCKMMAKKREQRYQSMAEVVTGIGEVLAAEGLARSERSTGRLMQPASGELDIQLPQTLPVDAGVLPPPDRPGRGNRGGQTAQPTSEWPPAGTSGRHDAPLASLSGSLGAPSVRGTSGRGTPNFGGSGSSSSGKLAAPAFMSTGHGDDGFTLASRGDEMIHRGDRLSGLKLYRQALAAHGLDGATRLRLEQELQKEITARMAAGENMLRRGMMVEASREWRIVVDLDPHDEKARGALKNLENKLSNKRTLINDIRTAIAGLQFEKAIELWEKTPLDLRDGQLGKQIEHLSTVIVPSQKLCEQGELFLEEGRLEEALATFQDALRMDGTCERARRGAGDAEGRLHRVEIMLREGYEFHLKQNFQKAIETWKPILRLRPGHPQGIKSIVDTYLAMALTHRQQGDLKGALQCYEGAHDEDPQNRSVSKHLEELTDLHDKEQALVDRANEALLNGRNGEAIRYWKEVLRFNPSNKTARTEIHNLGKAQRTHLLKVAVVLLVLSAGGFCGYQYFQEHRALGNAQIFSDIPAFPEALEALRQGEPYLFLKSQKENLELLCKRGAYEQEASALEKEGRFLVAVEVFHKLLLLYPEGAQKDQLALRMVALQARQQWALAEKALKAENWKESRTRFAECQVLLRAVEDESLKKLARDASLGLQFSGEIEAALKALHDGQRAVAIKHAKQAARLRSGDPHVQKLNQALGYDTQKAAEKVAEVRHWLGQPWKKEYYTEAQRALREARTADEANTDIENLEAYLRDLKACDASGMVLFTRSNVEKGGPFDDRDKAFCIDRFEYTEGPGGIPVTGLSWMEAKDTCEKRGDGITLCTRSQWVSACPAKQHVLTWTFGNTENKSACNWNSTEVKRVGAFADCHNEMGAFDMNGNVAEWVWDGKQAFEAGGHFASPMEEATCLKDMLKESALGVKSDRVGFRCCKPLPLVKK